MLYCSLQVIYKTIEESKYDIRFIFNDERTYIKPTHNFIEPKLLGRTLFEAVCSKNVEAIMIRFLYVLCKNFKTKQHFIEPNQEMKNQYYYCIYCLAYVDKKPNNHHKTILDHVMTEWLFIDSFQTLWKVNWKPSVMFADFW